MWNTRQAAGIRPAHTSAKSPYRRAAEEPGVLIWDEADLAVVELNAARALDGRASVIVVHGGPGSGRTTFLDVAVANARGAAAARGEEFSWRAIAGDVRQTVPFDGMRSWGVELERAESVTALDAEEALRDWIDDRLEEGPLLLTADDFQWFDPESVNALVRVMESAEAERLLLIVTVGHFEPFQHVGWQHFMTANQIVDRVELRGFSLETASKVARDIRPEIASGLIRRLWEHTDGNPLFFTSLITRNEPVELARMQHFPAPEGYARAIEVRLATLGHDAIMLARAVSVVGTGWMTLADAAFIAQIADPAAALDVLVSEFIVYQRTDDVGTSIRMVHAVIQASIYQHIPATERLEYHSRAATVAEDEPSELRHRLDAAASHDDALASRLEAASEREHSSGSYRLAAEYLLWSSSVSSDGLERSRRWLESVYESLLAGNLESAREQLPSLQRARDRRTAAMVEGAILVMENHWTEAARVLRAAASESGPDDLLSYRTLVLLAWASMVGGEPTVESLEPLERAESLGRRDDALAGLATITSAMLDRRQYRVMQIQRRLGALAARPAAVPLDDTYWLAWRGFSAVLYGRVQDAIGPLREVSSRMASGLMDVGDGLSNAFLGFGYWLGGEPELAAIQYRKAEALLRPRVNPMTAAYISFGYIGRGDLEHASKLVSDARAVLREAPWDEAVNVLLMASVAELHAAGSTAQRESLLQGLRTDFGEKSDQPSGAVSPMWKLHAAIAHIWAGETDEADQLADSISETDDLEWAPGVTSWLHGLAADRRGDLEQALTHLRQAKGAGTAPLPLFEGHIASDLARVEAEGGEPDAATADGRRAQAIYQRIGATVYLRQEEKSTVMEDIADDPNDAASVLAPPEGSAPPEVFAALSERERDVAVLLARGMSYQQIGRELFITRSTVGFHLSKIYAKTATSTRHELVELIRRPPLSGNARSVVAGT
jgi:DNA-binding CsgD family transcriptional regulator